MHFHLFLPRGPGAMEGAAGGSSRGAGACVVSAEGRVRGGQQRYQGLHGECREREKGEGVAAEVPGSA